MTNESSSVLSRAIEWLVTGETGTSSKTILAVMTGIVEGKRSLDYCVPLDASDFGRCKKLLNAIPEWREQLPKVAEAFPQWRLLIELWDSLDHLYDSGNWTPLNRILRVLREEYTAKAGE